MLYQPKYKKFLAVVFGLLLAGGFGLYLFQRFYSPVDMIAPENYNVPAGWKSYSNPSAGFRIKYDPGSKMDESGEIVRWYEWGPTQSAGTEVYDGFILTVYRANFLDTLARFIEDQMNSFRDVGGITVPLHDVTVNGIKGSSFTGSGLGVYTIIFFPIDSQSVLVVSSMAPDPGNLGFQKKIDTMLSTLELMAR